MPRTKAPKSKSHPDLNPEVSEKAHRRRFTAAYKLKILEEIDQASEPGSVGAVLRREGLYSSHLTKWRQQRELGVLAGLAPKKRGRKAKAPDPSAKRVAELEREVDRLRDKLRKAETIIGFQKKLSVMMGLDMPDQEKT